MSASRHVANGVFVTLAAVLAVLLLGAFGAFRTARGSRRFETYIEESAQGLSSGSAVRFRGTNPCVRVSARPPALDATAELARPYREVAVAAYTGAAPSVAGWRIVNSGQKHLGATFEARGGYVYMTPMQKGAMLIVR